jgi:hypothetical protein
MDAFGMVVIALSALVLLEVAAMHLRGEERHHPPDRPRRASR